MMDFGIARAIEEAGEALTKANVVMGSARYMSPEQSVVKKLMREATFIRQHAYCMKWSLDVPPSTRKLTSIWQRSILPRLPPHRVPLAR